MSTSDETKRPTNEAHETETPAAPPERERRPEHHAVRRPVTSRRRSEQYPRTSDEVAPGLPRDGGARSH